MQSGFCTGKGTREGIYDIYACFIDCEKAFDRVNHEKLIKCIHDIGMNGKDLRIIRNLYGTQQAFIQFE